MSNVGGKDNTVINRLLFRTDKKQAQGKKNGEETNMNEFKIFFVFLFSIFS